MNIYICESVFVCFRVHAQYTHEVMYIITQNAVVVI